jgi:hypothetical protein
MTEIDGWPPDLAETNGVASEMIQPVEKGRQVGAIRNFFDL